METTWLVMAVLALAAAVFAILMVRAQGASGFIRSELETARKDLSEAVAALDANKIELQAARDEAMRLKERIAKVDSVAGNSVPGTPGAGVYEPTTQTSDKPQTIVRRVEPAESVQQDAAPGEEAEGALRTVLFRPPPADEPEDSTAGMPYLKLSQGGDDEPHYLNFGSTWVGRDQENDIVIGDEAASRRHFEIIFSEHRFRLRDNESTNGTTCNGDTVNDVWLEFGDHITVGKTDMVFSCEGYELRDSETSKAIELLEKCVRKQPEFISALKILAFMLERDVGRKSEAAPLWDTITRLEK